MKISNIPVIYAVVPLRERPDRIAKALNLVNLGYRIRYPANHLSGGERQKVAARCTRICLLENGVLYGEGG